MTIQPSTTSSPSTHSETAAPRVVAPACEATWVSPLPADEIGRHERVRAMLRPGMRVTLADGLGDFIYSGLWDTMHSFYPAAAQNLPLLWAGRHDRYLKRDLRGEHYLQIPYTRLADFVVI